jgi:hypothetical protein
MTVVLYFSLNNSLNPFTLTAPRLGRRSFAHHIGGRPALMPRGGPRSMKMARSVKVRSDRSTDEILTVLPALARVADEVDADLRRWVIRLRELGVGWDIVGGALQLSEEDARQRFEGDPAT